MTSVEETDAGFTLPVLGHNDLNLFDRNLTNNDK